MGVPIRRTATVPRPGSSASALVSTYREHAAPPALARAVACTWEGRPGWSRSLRVVPDGGTDLAWDGRALRLARLVAGPVLLPLDAGPDRVGIRVRPGWAAAVLGAPVSHLPPLVSLAEIWDAATVEPIEARLAAAPTPAAGRALLAGLVRDRLAAADDDGRGHGERVDRRVLAAVGHLALPHATVDTAAGAAGLGVRQLRRLFDHHVGVRPKTLQVIARFQRFMAGAATARDRWHTAAQAAAECGYTDQSHLARDCRRLAGTTPGGLLAPRTG